MNEAPDELKALIYHSNQGLLKAREADDIHECARIVQRFVAQRSNYSGPDSLLHHGNLLTDWGAVVNVYRALEANEGGLWCGGVGTLLAASLNAIGVRAEAYTYGYSPEGLSHTTCVYAVSDAQWVPHYYVIDAYLCYYYTDLEGTLMPLTEIWRNILAERYDRIVRVDVEIERNLVADSEEEGKARGWLFPGPIPVPERSATGKYVYPGAILTFDKMFGPTTPITKLADRRRGSQPLEDYLCELMLVKPHFSLQQCQQCYPDISLRDQLVAVMTEGR